MKDKQGEKLRVFYKGKNVGMIIFSEDCSFEGDIPKEVADIITKVRNRIVHEGVTEMGDIISKEPIKIDKKYWLFTLWIELGDLGINFKS